MRIRLDIAYDGTHFRGWAKQPGLRTVQGTIEQALARIVGPSAEQDPGAPSDAGPRLVVAGRTDAGVHATGQVAHVDLDEQQWSRVVTRNGRAAADPASGASGAADPASSLASRIRGVLGQYPDVTVSRTALAPEGFDARFSAVWRRYRYRLADARAGYDPLLRHDTTTIKGSLDEGAMDAAAQTLIGLHDFAAYCKPREEATTIRTLLDYRWVRDATGVLVAEVKADAFCHSMVRALVGACAAVGEGRLEVADLARLRDELTRTSAFKVLAARGLTLTEVGYPADELLAARAEQTRNRRGQDD
ncbi:tRNA pseudouridine(38-40) synthase TruA [Microbacterium sp. Au-Mic1]|uniref:tRNA pseudouridine(38-40) synthase TruA n=1 Tax=Microbacterium sp. Au-Mic1 TaxID=2906457 RepID=UPI001E3ABF61|nr:tRNA pseudouridine(38-40) synthase TruA [Microbacterium sp. Au-Mic1]MCE4027342.1 tRNA pseudouridine(38-40) synthase TruA [Microbacterium sp. Au-Mic1]